ncbi:ESX secretion-associated protein EspG [Nocardia salmonicida]|uniref:ESX secretion-associated protein EspG n=1 Tax=Nocardia salmonicida TaxID=53431 RepID=UPI0034043F4D
MITQRPGETLAHSGGFDAVECDPYSLADAVIGLLPRCGAGKLADIALSLPDTAPIQERDRPVSSIADEDDEDDLSDDPALSTGIVKVLQGHSKYGPRGRIETGLLWRDLPDDGRYVMPLDDPAPVASAMSSDRLAIWMRDRIEEILTRMESHSETEE